MSPNLESKTEDEFDKEEAEKIRRIAETLEKLTQARVIIEKACDEALPLIDDEFLADNYEVDSIDFIVATVRTALGYTGSTWPNEELLMHELF